MQKLEWFSPLWSSRLQPWRALRRYIFSQGPLTRIIAGSLIASTAIIVAFKWLVPGLVLPNLLPLLFLLPAILLMMTLQTWAIASCRTRVVIKSESIQITHGQSSVVIDAASFSNATISIHDHDRIRLSIYYQRKNGMRRKTVGLSPELSVNQLKLTLWGPVEIKDYRSFARSKRAALRFINA